MLSAVRSQAGVPSFLGLLALLTSRRSARPPVLQPTDATGQLLSPMPSPPPAKHKDDVEDEDDTAAALSALLRTGHKARLRALLQSDCVSKHIVAEAERAQLDPSMLMQVYLSVIAHLVNPCTRARLEMSVDIQSSSHSRLKRALVLCMFQRALDTGRARRSSTRLQQSSGSSSSRTRARARRRCVAHLSVAVARAPTRDSALASRSQARNVAIKSLKLLAQFVETHGQSLDLPLCIAARIKAAALAITPDATAAGVLSVTGKPPIEPAKSTRTCSIAHHRCTIKVHTHFKRKTRTHTDRPPGRPVTLQRHV